MEENADEANACNRVKGCCITPLARDQPSGEVRRVAATMEQRSSFALRVADDGRQTILSLFGRASVAHNVGVVRKDVDGWDWRPWSHCGAAVLLVQVYKGNSSQQYLFYQKYFAAASIAAGKIFGG